MATVAAAVAEQPQAKLGRLPKNARLIEAMAQHKNAKPKPKGWLMAVVDCIYKEGKSFWLFYTFVALHVTFMEGTLVT
jgi:hypothetical protein